MIEKIDIKTYLANLNTSDELKYALGINSDNSPSKSNSLCYMTALGSYDYYKSKNYLLHKFILSLLKPDEGSKKFTITLIKLNDASSDYCIYDFKLIAAALKNSNSRTGILLFCANSSSQYSTYAHLSDGNFSNIRIITYNEERYIAVDVEVQQYGANAIYITGVHENISDIMDVTGNFTEVE